MTNPLNPIETVQAPPCVWVEFADNGNVVLWTAAQGRARREADAGRNMQMFVPAQMQQPSDEREAFEAYMKQEKLGSRPTPDGGGSYAVTEVRWAWAAWQAARALGPVKAQQEPQGKVQLPDKARAGIEELHRVVESLLTTSRYVDEEGDATQALADLSDCIADPPFRLAAHQGAQPAVPQGQWRQSLGERLSEMLADEDADWCDARNVDALIDMVLAAAPSASVQPQECVELDAAGIPKIPMTLLEQKAVATCNTIKAWLDSGLSMPFPDDGREGVEVVLMFAAARREGVR